MAAAAGWRKRIELIVEVGLRGAAAGTFQWDVSSWDSGAGWSGLEPTFVALEPSEVAGVTIQRGRRSGVERYRTGTAQVQLVWRSPEDHWILRPSPPVQLGQELRLLARVDGSSSLVPLYRGGIRDISDDWSPDGPYRVTVQLSDRKADLAAVDLPERPVEGLGDATDERLSRILGLASISDFYTSFEPGLATHQSSNFARNLLDEAEVTVEGEGGSFYVDRAGLFVFLARGWVFAAPRSTEVQLLWSNVLGDPDAVAPLGFSTGQSLGDLVNQVSMAKAGGVAYTAGPDTDSVLTFGLRTYQRFDLTLQDQADVELAADARLAELHNRTRKLEQLSAEVDPRQSASWIRALLDQELGDMQQLIWDDGSGTPMAEAYHVQGLTHRVTQDRWTVSTALWHYAGTTVASTWGSGLWGSATWSSA